MQVQEVNFENDDSDDDPLSFILCSIFLILSWDVEILRRGFKGNIVVFLLATLGALSLDGVSPSVFRCTSIPMETGPIVTCGET